MTDVFDRAQARDQEILSDALAEHSRRSAAKAPHSAEICSVCDSRIPEERRKAIPGVQTCVECQRDIERKGPYDWGMAE